jgi:uncharacterized protein YdeI (YjbR/CyaY-like superfamily)
LTEEVKWRVPCYTFQGKNVVLISALKDYCTLSFTKGALLQDAKSILAKPGKNTRAARLLRFTNVQAILESEALVKSYILEAIELEKSGLKVDFEQDRGLEYPRELEDKLDKCPAFRTAFDSLTPGRQRGYLLYFSGAKRASTREARVEKYVQRILDGKGLNDCICGMSRKLPNCDGSHQDFR